MSFSTYFFIYSNDFEDYASISFLFICPKLENLVLKGNAISYDDDYRPTIFRILPNLKNLDVIMMQRAPKMVCKKDKNPSDDNYDGPSPEVVNYPKELQGTYFRTKQKCICGRYIAVFLVLSQFLNSFPLLLVIKKIHPHQKAIQTVRCKAACMQTCKIQT